ncbi:MAG: beta-lactamase family protein [Proteobacteria bacterium]|nr:beta-lactamase family protein [Pseudomonadota bacterium]
MKVVDDAPERSLMQALEEAVFAKCFSAAQLVVSGPGKTLLSLCAGMTRLDSMPSWEGCPALEVSPETLFDVASLTKPLVTAGLLMVAQDEGRISLTQKLVSLPLIRFPSWMLDLTLADLLCHATPLMAWYDFHGHLPRLEERETASRRIEREILALPPRTDAEQGCYSDLGYMLLGIFLERLYGESLTSLFARKIAHPLGLEDRMLFCPLHRFAQSRCAATHLVHGYALQGHPDDNNARSLTHVAGHAGLFATAEAVADYVRALFDGRFPARRETVDAFLGYKNDRTRFALGWDRPGGENSLSGRSEGDPVVGHLGFTGCSVWVDLSTKTSITFLTNRSHCNDDPAVLATLRRTLHKQLWSQVW